MIPLTQEHVDYLTQLHSPQSLQGAERIESTPAMATSDPQFPDPHSVAPLIGREQLGRQFAILGDLLNAGTLLIDVRRTDYEGGTIRGSLNHLRRASRTTWQHCIDFVLEMGWRSSVG